MMWDEQWWERGECRDANPAIFEGDGRRPVGRPRRDHAKRERDWTAARRMCGACEVRQDCLTFMLSDESFRDADMFAAGYTPEQLKELRRRVRLKKEKGA